MMAMPYERQPMTMSKAARAAFLQKLANEALDKARALPDDERIALGPINWGDLGCIDVVERRSILYADRAPLTVVLIEEAGPGATRLQEYVGNYLEAHGFPDIVVETDW